MQSVAHPELSGGLPNGERPELRDLAHAQAFTEALLTGGLDEAWEAGEALMGIDSGPLTETERTDGLAVRQLPNPVLSFDRSQDPMAVTEALSGIEDPDMRRLRVFSVIRQSLLGGLGVQRAFRGRTNEPEAGIAVLGPDMLPQVYTMPSYTAASPQFKQTPLSERLIERGYRQTFVAGGTPPILRWAREHPGPAADLVTHVLTAPAEEVMAAREGLLAAMDNRQGQPAHQPAASLEVSRTADAGSVAEGTPGRSETDGHAETLRRWRTTAKKVDLGELLAAQTAGEQAILGANTSYEPREVTVGGSPHSAGTVLVVDPERAAADYAARQRQVIGEQPASRRPVVAGRHRSQDVAIHADGALQPEGRPVTDEAEKRRLVATAIGKSRLRRDEARRAAADGHLDLADADHLAAAALQAATAARIPGSASTGVAPLPTRDHKPQRRVAPGVVDPAAAHAILDKLQGKRG